MIDILVQQRKIWRLQKVLEHFPVGKTTWWQGVKDGRYPKPVRLGQRAVGWYADEIDALILSLAN